MKVEIWSDVVCPWCYLGKRRFERALAGFEHRDQVEVQYRSYELDPSAPTDSVRPTAAHLAEKIGVPVEQAKAMMRGVEQTAAQEGLEYHHVDGVSGNTALAHQLLHLAADRGLTEVATERLYRAYFTESRSVFDLDALVALGVEAGLDGAEVREALTDGRYVAAVHADAREAAALGASGVPFFVIDRAYGVAGAQPSEVFTDVLQQAWTAAHPLTMVSAAGDAATSCDEQRCAL